MRKNGRKNVRKMWNVRNSYAQNGHKNGRKMWNVRNFCGMGVKKVMDWKYPNTTMKRDEMRQQ